MRALLRLGVVLGLLYMQVGTASAAGVGRFLADHAAFDIAGVGAWRAAWADDRSPGFHLAGGGAEINFGLEFENGLGVLIGGRSLFLSHLGRNDLLSGMYVDAGGQLMATLRVTDWVRVGLGGSAGRLWRCCGDAELPELSALLLGGFLRIGIDLLPRNALPRALGLWLRINIDGTLPGVPTTYLPQTSMNVAIGVGMRL